MEYIKPEEFLKQPKKVQGVFRKWWKPEMYDLFFRNFGNNPNNFLRGTYIGCIQDNETKINAKRDKTWLPILTEGQLREFIESKTSSKIDITLLENGDSPIYVFDDSIRYEVEAKDLFRAYWWVACKIAEEG